jgi:DNA replication protein DnaC
MNAAEHLDTMLTRLKLTAMRERLDTLLDEAARAQMTLRKALAHRRQTEIAHQDQRRIQMGLSTPTFPFVRTLEGFDYDAQPAVDPKPQRELATGRWIGNGDSVLLLGPPGVGKTHLAVALGREAIPRGYSVLFTTATVLMTTLSHAHAQGRLDERLSHLQLVRNC